MPTTNTPSNARRQRARSAFQKLATGGDWALTQSETVRRNLIWFWCDGCFASASDNIIATYMVIYLLALGANQAQIGLMSSFSSLSAALLLLPGAMLVERIGRRRNLVLLGGGWARLALLFIALLPLLIHSPALIILLMGLSVSRDAMANLSFPAWMSLTGDIVPIEGRGRYFASRNFIMGLSGMVITFLAGLLITHMPQPASYQIVLLAAFAIGSLSIYSFAHLTDRPRPLATPQVKEPLNLPGLWRTLTSQREFTRFAIMTALWNFSLNIAGPFFTVYLAKNLRADATMIALTTIASSLATMLGQRKLGELNDRWGARRLAMVSALLIPIVPFLWIFASAGWHIIPINLISGLLWGGFNLASFNYLLQITPEAQRARFSAVFQIIVTTSLAVGAAVGSLMITYWSFKGVFLASSLGRLAAALLFVWLLAPRKKASPAQVAQS